MTNVLSVSGIITQEEGLSVAESVGIVLMGSANLMRTVRQGQRRRKQESQEKQGHKFFSWVKETLKNHSGVAQEGEEYQDKARSPSSSVVELREKKLRKAFQRHFEI
jgi:hypothetical protein